VGKHVRDQRRGGWGAFTKKGRENEGGKDEKQLNLGREWKKLKMKHYGMGTRKRKFRGKRGEGVMEAKKKFEKKKTAGKDGKGE